MGQSVFLVYTANRAMQGFQGLTVTQDPKAIPDSTEFRVFQELLEMKDTPVARAKTAFPVTQEKRNFIIFILFQFQN
jgi:hypothetical protein